MPERRKSFPAVLGEQDRNRLQHLAATNELSMSAVIRRLIKDAFIMTAQNIRICANGTPCPLPKENHEQQTQPPNHPQG